MYVSIRQRKIPCSNLRVRHLTGFLHTYPPIKMEQAECSKIQTLGNYAEENIRHSKHDESLKSVKLD